MKIRRYDSHRRPPKVFNTGVDTSAPDSHYVSDGCGSSFNWMKLERERDAMARRWNKRKREEKAQ